MIFILYFLNKVYKHVYIYIKNNFKEKPSFWYDGENLSGLSYQATIAYATFSDSFSNSPFNRQ